MINFDPERSSLHFGNKYYGVTAAVIYQKDPESPFCIASLEEVTGVKRGNLNSPLGRLIKLQMIHQVNPGLQGEMFRLEHKDWEWVGPLALSTLVEPLQPEGS